MDFNTLTGEKTFFKRPYIQTYISITFHLYGEVVIKFNKSSKWWLVIFHQFGFNIQ